MQNLKIYVLFVLLLSKRTICWWFDGDAGDSGGGDGDGVMIMARKITKMGRERKR